MTVTTQTRAPWSQLRLRQSAHMRDLVAETTFSVAQLIQPLFVVEGMTGASPVPGLGDVARQSEPELLEQVGRDLDAGVRHFLLFCVPASKRTHSLSFDHARRATAAIKGRFGEAVSLWVDICLCSSTDHGHCALLDRDGRIDLGSTLDALAQMAVDVADAGADGVSPSDMMDGRTAHLRAALDDRGHQRVPIMSYSTKFASQFYGPFREAAGSAPQFGDRRHYQIDVRARRDAIASSVRCAQEGADLLMVKPGMTSIDLIRPIVEATGRSVGAYQVSGEYAGLLALAAQGLTMLDAALLETWYVFRRAGAAYIITYGARDAKRMGL
jgi:porphobilinogen synthase